MHNKVATFRARRGVFKWKSFCREASISAISLSLRLGWEGARLHAFGLSCLLVCLTPRSTESPGRHVHSYPVQAGPSSRHRQNCTVSARGDFVSVTPDSTLEGGPGIELVLLSAIIFLYVLFFFVYFIFYLFILPSRVTFSFNLPAYVIRTSYRPSYFNNIIQRIYTSKINKKTHLHDSDCPICNHCPVYCPNKYTPSNKGTHLVYYTINDIQCIHNWTWKGKIIT